MNKINFVELSDEMNPVVKGLQFKVLLIKAMERNHQLHLKCNNKELTFYIESAQRLSVPLKV